MGTIYTTLEGPRSADIAPTTDAGTVGLNYEPVMANTYASKCFLKFMFFVNNEALNSYDPEIRVGLLKKSNHPPSLIRLEHGKVPRNPVRRAAPPAEALATGEPRRCPR